jgi:hypothetical protein
VARRPPSLARDRAVPQTGWRERCEGDALTGEQAERLAGSLGQVGDDKQPKDVEVRLKDVEVRLSVLSWVVGFQFAVALAVFWRFFAPRSEVSPLGGDTRARPSAVEQRLGALPAVPR